MNILSRQSQSSCGRLKRAERVARRKATEKRATRTAVENGRNAHGVATFYHHANPSPASFAKRMSGEKNRQGCGKQTTETETTRRLDEERPAINGAVWGPVVAKLSTAKRVVDRDRGTLSSSSVLQKGPLGKN